MINIGTNLSLAKLEVERTPQGGYKTFYTYEGTREACTGYLVQLPTGAAARTDDSAAPLVRLHVSFPWLEVGNTSPEPPTNTYELPGNSVTKDIYEHPAMLALGPITVSLIARKLAELSKLENDDTATPEILENSYNAAISVIEAFGNNHQVDGARAAAFFKLLFKKQTSYQDSVYVFKHSRTVGNRTQISVAFSDVGKIYTADQVISEAAVPQAIFFSINAIPQPANIAGGIAQGFAWGWLKQAPQIHQEGGGKFLVTVEWILDQWSTAVYDQK